MNDVIAMRVGGCGCVSVGIGVGIGVRGVVSQLGKWQGTHGLPSWYTVDNGGIQRTARDLRGAGGRQGSQRSDWKDMTSS